MWQLATNNRLGAWLRDQGSWVSIHRVAVTGDDAYFLAPPASKHPNRKKYNLMGV
jgi:hypothetical protein